MKARMLKVYVAITRNHFPPKDYVVLTFAQMDNAEVVLGV
jgi:hypothetical protein